MGRELRRVPPNWKHPIDGRNGEFQPMFDKSFLEACEQWKKEFLAWEQGIRPDYFSEDNLKDMQYWEYEGGPPTDRQYYRPYSDKETTWFCIFETVSEGTPVTPPFETKEQLIQYLITKGDLWDQNRMTGPWSRQAAERIVNEEGYAPSLIISKNTIQSPGHDPEQII